MKALSKLVATAITTFLVGVPALAWACPACASRESASWGVFGLVAAMISVPYFAAVIVIKVVRRLDQPEPARRL